MLPGGKLGHRDHEVQLFAALLLVQHPQAVVLLTGEPGEGVLLELVHEPLAQLVGHAVVLFVGEGETAVGVAVLAMTGVDEVGGEIGIAAEDLGEVVTIAEVGEVVGEGAAARSSSATLGDEPEDHRGSSGRTSTDFLEVGRWARRGKLEADRVFLDEEDAASGEACSRKRGRNTSGSARSRASIVRLFADLAGDADTGSASSKGEEDPPDLLELAPGLAQGQEHPKGVQGFLVVVLPAGELVEEIAHLSQGEKRRLDVVGEAPCPLHPAHTARRGKLPQTLPDELAHGDAGGVSLPAELAVFVVGEPDFPPPSPLPHRLPPCPRPAGLRSHRVTLERA